MHLDQRPVELTAVRLQEQGQISESGQGLLVDEFGAGRVPAGRARS